MSVAPRSTTIWLTLASAAIVVDAALLTPEAATHWPLLIDIDAETAGTPLADDVPPFTDRWFALPSNWFASWGQ